MAINEINPKGLVKSLYSERPKFHGREDAGTYNYSIKPNVLNWIADNVPKNSNCLETGCGYTTVLLSAISKKHTVISPFKQEHDLIKSWCKDNNISCDHVTMIPQISQDVVPNLEIEDLDFILIDGDHAFPAPFIDWYYTADKLKIGGFLVVDDTHIPTGTILRDFLLKEVDRWSLVKDIGTTAVFKRISEANVARDVLFIQQPYCKVKTPSLSTRIINKLKKQFT